MKKLLSLLILVLLLVPNLAQVQATELLSGTVASLPSAPTAGTSWLVTNGLTSGDCTSGGGTYTVLCTYTGGAWTTPNSSAGSVAFSGISSGTNTSAAMIVGTGASLETTGTDKAAANKFIWRHNATDLDTGGLGKFGLTFGTGGGINGQTGLRNDSAWNLGYNCDFNVIPLLLGEHSACNTFESFYSPAADVNSQSVTNITSANPGVVTYSGADSYTNGMSVKITAIAAGTLATALNNKVFQVANVNTGANTFELRGKDTTGLTGFGGSPLVVQTFANWEYHIGQSFDTSDPAFARVHRAITMAYPVAGELSGQTGGQAQLGFSANRMFFTDYGDTPVQHAVWDWGSGLVDFNNVTNDTVLRFNNPAVDTYYPLQTRNAADSAFLRFPYYDAHDSMNFNNQTSLKGFYFTGGRQGASASSGFAGDMVTIADQTGATVTSGDSQLHLVGPSANTSAVTYSALTAQGNVSNGNYQIYLKNTSTVDNQANARLVLEAANGGGSPYVDYAPLGGTTWSTGVDITNSSAFTISKQAGLGANRIVLITTGNVFQPLLYGSQTNCSDGTATPADCTAAPAGSVIISSGATAVVVNTTAVTANSQILIQEDSSLGTKLSVTCNTTIARTYAVTARTGGTSFTITTSAAPVTNPACLSYFIVN